MDDESIDDEGSDPVQPTMKLLADGDCAWCPEDKSNQPIVELNAYGPEMMVTEICEYHLRQALALFSRKPPN